MLAVDTLELKIQFLPEEQPEPYYGTVKRVPQGKIGYEAKNLGGVFGSAKEQTKVVY